MALIIAPILKPWAIAYSLEASTLLVILLHLTKDQWTIFALFNESASTKIYPIYIYIVGCSYDALVGLRQ